MESGRKLKTPPMVTAAVPVASRSVAQIQLTGCHCLVSKGPPQTAPTHNTTVRTMRPSVVCSRKFEKAAPTRSQITISRDSTCIARNIRGEAIYLKPESAHSKVTNHSKG